MYLMKFGGTSVATAENITLVKNIIVDKAQQGQVIAVVSALGGITTALIQCSKKAAAGDKSYAAIFDNIESKHIKTVQGLIDIKHQGKTLGKVKVLLNELEDILKGVFLIHELSPKTQDRILSYGETLSATIITNYLQDQKHLAQLADPKAFVITDDYYGRANVDFPLTEKKVKDYFSSQDPIVICPGFVAANHQGETTTLGRGGSDYTAAILAAALHTETLEIWTDVSGMMTADPRLVKSAYAIPRISYEEAMELSHFGAKVIYPPTIQPVLEKNIPIHIKNTFKKDDTGTVISNQPNGNGRLIKGLSCISNVALFNLTGSGMVGIPDFSHRLFQALAQAKVNVVMITQASSEHSICVGVDTSDLKKSKKAVNQEFRYEMAMHKIDPLETEDGLSIIALVGSNMKSQVGVSGKMFTVLGQNGINIKAIAQGSSEKNISVVIRETQMKKALNSLHESFFLSEKKRLNLFIIGVGNVGSALIDQLKSQKNYLSEHHHIDLRIVALANSKKMIFDKEGTDLENWEEALQAQGVPMNMENFIDQMVALNLRNSIFIDNTANERVAAVYQNVLEKSISVVTPNKIACTGTYEHYCQLKAAALRYRSKFLYETNVGAGLPVINTLNDLIKSGDEIIKIEAVLSGSLNFIFNHFTNQVKFADIVKQAQEEGYTEPDPRIDLSGIDVKRKILILIRECGIPMEIKDIHTEHFIPKDCMKAENIAAFYQSLDTHEAGFQQLLAKAESQQKKIKYVAGFDRGMARSGIQMVGDDHPFYHLEGKDNIVLFTTKRYPDQPLVIKGAGAGAAVTASGIFADIMRIANG